MVIYGFFGEGMEEAGSGWVVEKGGRGGGLEKLLVFVLRGRVGDCYKLRFFLDFSFFLLSLFSGGKLALLEDSQYVVFFNLLIY